MPIKIFDSILSMKIGNMKLDPIIPIPNKILKNEIGKSFFFNNCFSRSK